MAISITINNKTFSIPVAGEDPGWGEDTTAWIQEASKILNTLFGGGDLAETTATIDNNITSAQNINGLVFNPATIRAAFIEYSIYRVSDTTQSGTAEVGFMLAVYDNNGTSGNKWIFTREFGGDSGVTIDVTDAGQFTFTSTDIGSTNYSGTMRFKARTISQ